MSHGAQSMVKLLRRVVVRAPQEPFLDADPTTWHYTGPIDRARALDEHAAFVSLLEAAGAEVIHHDEALPDLADSIFVHDPVLVTDAGTVALAMGKARRRGEEAPLARRLEAAGVPLLGSLEGEARAEGGDLLWLDPTALAVGIGFRTDRSGLAQLETLLAPLGVTCVAVPLPVHAGADACLHLMSVISMIDDDLAVAFEPLLSVEFWRLLRGRGVAIVPVPEEELATQAPNVLALAPRRCLMLEGNPITRARLEAAGCEVDTYVGDEISLKAEGGPTCLTRPVWRA